MIRATIVLPQRVLKFVKHMPGSKVLYVTVTGIPGFLLDRQETPGRVVRTANIWRNKNGNQTKGQNKTKSF